MKKTILFFLMASAVFLIAWDFVNALKFEFYSDGGGPERIPTWHMTVFPDSRIQIEKILDGRAEKCGNVNLDTDQNYKLWKYISRMEPAKYPTSARNGIVDEGQMTFIYQKPDKNDEYKVWSNDARKDNRISEFVNYAYELINKSCKK